MDVIEELKKAIEILNRIDDYSNSLGNELSELDSKEQDLLHYIEGNKINVLWCYRIVKEIKNVRESRRKVKNDMSVLTKYNENKAKLPSKEYRQFLLAEVCKYSKILSNTKYKNRVYTEEQMQKILKGV